MASVVVNDAYLEDIADAIRAKLSSQDTYKPSEMASAINSISGGITPTGTKQISITQNGTTTEDVTNYASAEITVNVSGGGGGTLTLKGVSSLTISGDSSSETEFIATVPLLSSLNTKSTTTYQKIKITHNSSTVTGSFEYANSTNNSTLTEIDLGENTVISIGPSGLRGYSALKKIVGLVKLTSTSYVFYTNALEDVRFAENATAVNIPLDRCSSLTDASVISAGNGADESVSKTFTLVSAVKTRVSSIKGNSVEVTSGGVTYHRFVADANGSMTFADFMTNVKGWTF